MLTESCGNQSVLPSDEATVHSAGPSDSGRTFVAHEDLPDSTHLLIHHRGTAPILTNAISSFSAANSPTSRNSRKETARCFLPSSTSLNSKPSTSPRAARPDGIVDNDGQVEHPRLKVDVSPSSPRSAAARSKRDAAFIDIINEYTHIMTKPSLERIQSAFDSYHKRRYLDPSEKLLLERYYAANENFMKSVERFVTISAAQDEALRNSTVRNALEVWEHCQRTNVEIEKVLHCLRTRTSLARGTSPRNSETLPAMRSNALMLHLGSPTFRSRNQRFEKNSPKSQSGSPLASSSYGALGSASPSPRNFVNADVGSDCEGGADPTGAASALLSGSVVTWIGAALPSTAGFGSQQSSAGSENIRPRENRPVTLTTNFTGPPSHRPQATYRQEAQARRAVEYITAPPNIAAQPRSLLEVRPPERLWRGSTSVTRWNAELREKTNSVSPSMAPGMGHGSFAKLSATLQVPQQGNRSTHTTPEERKLSVPRNSSPAYYTRNKSPGSVSARSGNPSSASSSPRSTGITSNRPVVGSFVSRKPHKIKATSENSNSNSASNIHNASFSMPVFPLGLGGDMSSSFSPLTLASNSVGSPMIDTKYVARTLEPTTTRRFYNLLPEPLRTMHPPDPRDVPAVQRIRTYLLNDFGILDGQRMYNAWLAAQTPEWLHILRSQTVPII